MLVLARKCGQRIRIGQEIVITVLEPQGNYCRLGIEAPRDVRVDRDEVRERIEHENRQAQPRDGLARDVERRADEPC